MSVAPLPVFGTPAQRFETLRAAGTDPSPQQNGMNALRHLAGRSGESMASFWPRWSGVLDAHRLGERSGDEVVCWVGTNLVDVTLLQAHDPDDPDRFVAARTTLSCHDAIDAFERKREALDRAIHQIEERCHDADNLGIDDDTIHRAWAVANTYRRRLTRLQGLLTDALGAARARDDDRRRAPIKKRNSRRTATRAQAATGS